MIFPLLSLDGAELALAVRADVGVPGGVEIGALAVFEIVREEAGIDAPVAEGVDAVPVLETVLEGALVDFAAHVGVGPLAGHDVGQKRSLVHVAVGKAHDALPLLEQVRELPGIDIPVGIGDLLPVQIDVGGNAVGIDELAAHGLPVRINAAEEFDVKVRVDSDLDIPVPGAVEQHPRRRDDHQRDEQDDQDRGEETALFHSF